MLVEICHRAEATNGSLQTKDPTTVSSGLGRKGFRPSERLPDAASSAVRHFDGRGPKHLPQGLPHDGRHEGKGCDHETDATKANHLILARHTRPFGCCGCAAAYLVHIPLAIAVQPWHGIVTVCAAVRPDPYRRPGDRGLVLWREPPVGRRGAELGRSSGLRRNGMVPDLQRRTTRGIGARKIPEPRALHIDRDRAFCPCAPV